MRLTISKSALAAAIAAPSRIAARAKVEATACIRVAASAAYVSFDATDMDESASVRAEAMVEEPGDAMIPAKMLSSIVKALPDAAVSIECDGTCASIGCRRSSFTLPAMDPSLFPVLPSVGAESSVTVPGEIFADLAKRGTAFPGDGHATELMRSALVEASGGRVRFATADGYRLIEVSAEIPDGTEFKGAIPARFLRDVPVSPSADVTIAMAANQVRVESGDTAMATRAVMGDYPDVDRVLGAIGAVRAEVGRSVLLGMAKRAAAIGRGAKLDVRVGSGEVSLSLDGDGSGMSDSAPAECSGEGSVCVNPAFFQACAANLPDGAVEIALGSPGDPLHLSGAGTRIALMPIRRQ